MGGYLGDIDLRLPFWVSAALTFANACYGFFVLPESLPKEIRKPFSWSRANPQGSLRLLRSAPGLLPMAISFFTYQLAHTVFSSVFVLYTDMRFGWTPGQIGQTLAIVGILNVIVQGALIRPMMRILGERTMVFLGLIGGMLGFTAYGLASNGSMFMASTIIFCTLGFFSAAIQGLMSKRIDPSTQGQLSGANSSLNGIAGMIGPILFTSVFKRTIDPEGGFHQPGAPFFLAALILGLGLLCAMIAIPKQQADSTPST
jgi:DHA1 family tetracycline resistance protein-like MFS transporter